VYSATEKKDIAYYAFIYHFDYDDPDINGSDFATYFSRFDEMDYERFDKKRQKELGLPESPQSEPAVKPPPDNTARFKPISPEVAAIECPGIPDDKTWFTVPWIEEEYNEFDPDDTLDCNTSHAAAQRAYARSDGACPREWWMVAIFVYMRTVDRKDRSEEDFETRYLPSFTIELFREYRPLWELRATYGQRCPDGLAYAERRTRRQERQAEKEAKLAAEKTAGETEAVGNEE